MEYEGYIKERNRMVEQQIINRGINDKKVIEIMRLIPRHLFVDKEDKKKAYEDYPLSIGENQTISQPYMVALMTECLELSSNDKVLEIGTGSGYQTAILAKLSGEVYTVERFVTLSLNAKRILDSLGILNVKYKVGDGTKSWSEYSPYDKITVTAGAPKIPEPLIAQLKDDGVLVIPLDTDGSQMLTVVKKVKGNIEKKQICACTFVPLVGEYGWSK